MPLAPAQHIRRVLPRLLLCVALGLLTTGALTASLAAFVPIEKAPARVALDGDHLQPWLIDLACPGARRTIWFEKGRIYTKAQYGPRDGSGSSAAVSCWSFAISTRRDPRTTRGAIEIPREIAEATQANPPTSWGGCLDKRGWPLPAAQTRVLGLMSPLATAAYRTDWGAPLTNDRIPSGRGSLADVRMIPYRPIWSGLAVDAALYAGLWWCLLLVPRFVAAKWRRKQGSCPACGYDLTGLTTGVCPECGTAR
jgi:hypothetical protein